MSCKSSRRVRIRISLFALVVALLIVPDRAWGQDSTTAPAAQEGLFPCLAIAADGSPVWPSTSFPPSTRLTVAFRLKPDQSAKSLHSKWISVNGTESLIAENTLDLKGQKSGWLRLELKQPAPVGNYRLDATLDGQPWKSIDLQITPPPEDGKAEKPSDLIPLTEGLNLTYDLVVRSYNGTKVEIPNVKPDPDGASRATLAFNIGKTDDTGTHWTGSINGKPAGEMWVKIDDKGLQAVRRKSGDQIKDLNPPELVHALPPSLENGTEWTATRDGDKLELQLFGPIPVEGPDGPAPGYLIFSQKDVAIGSPGEPATRGKESVEKYFLPKVGLVREVHVNVLAGKLTSRQEITLAAGKPYRLVANPNMKGRLGRLQVAYPPETNFSQAQVSVYKAGAKPEDKPLTSGYGDKSFDLMPGKYEVAINKKRVPVEVKSGHDTVPLCGVLRVHAGSQTRFRVLDTDGKTELHDAYGEHDVPLPAGSYLLEIAGTTEPVKIEDGKVTEF